MNNPNNKNNFNEGGKPVDYKARFFEYLLYWPIFIICLILALGGAYVYLRYQAPVYSVSSTVLIKQGDKTKSSAILFACKEGRRSPEVIYRLLSGA